MDIIAKPFGMLLKFCNDITGSYALALLFFTLLFKLILLPLSIKQQKSSQAQARIRPKEMAIRKRYIGRTDTNANAELSRDLMKLYQEEKYSPAGGCLPLLLQLPIIYILYQIITKPIQYICNAADKIAGFKESIFNLFKDGILNSSNTSEQIYGLFTKAGGDIGKFDISEIQMLTIMQSNSANFPDAGIVYPDFTIFGGTIDLSAFPTFTSIMILIPLFAALFQFASSFVMRFFTPQLDKSTPEGAQAQKTMLYMNIIFPAITFFMAFSFPAILGLYWIYQSIFSTVTQVILAKIFPIPVFTPEQYAEIEADVNKDYVKPDIKSYRKSLHNIDEYDYEPDYPDLSEDKVISESNIPEPYLPPRRKYDKNGNKIRSLHFIDEDEEEQINSITLPETKTEVNNTELDREFTPDKQMNEKKLLQDTSFESNDNEKDTNSSLDINNEKTENPAHSDENNGEK